MNLSAKTWLAALLALQLAGCNSRLASGGDIQRTLDRFAANYQGVGVVAAVVDHGKTTIYTAGSLGPHAPALDENTVFQIGSITKTFTATLLASMVQDGEVRLGEPIEHFLPDGVAAPTYAGRPITLLSLAEHNSGLPRIPTNLKPTDVVDPYADYTPAMLYDFLSHYELPRAPGSHYEYSNLGVGLLGDLLANRTHEAYGTLLRLRVLRPLGMGWTAVTPQPWMLEHLAPGHTIDGDPQPPWSFAELGAAGALYYSAHDMLRYLRANLAAPQGALGKAMEFAQHPRADGGFNGLVQVGLAWDSNEESGFTWHDGETGGYHAFIGFDVGQRSGVVVLANVANADVDTVAAHILLPDRVAPPAPWPAVVALSASELSRYAGTYRLGRDDDVTIVAQGDRLFAQLSGNDPFRIYPSSVTEFFAKATETRVSFEIDASGVVRGLLLRQGGTAREAPRIK